MGFGDDFLQGLEDKASNVVSNVAQSAGDFIQNHAQEVLVKVDPNAPVGAPTPEQLANGVTGSGVGLKPSPNAVQSVVGTSSILIVAAIAAYLLWKE